MSFNVSENKNCKSLTEMFCNQILGKNVSVIDLLERDLPKQWEKKWMDANPSFSSTMRKHLVIGQEQSEVENKKSKRFHYIL